ADSSSHCLAKYRCVDMVLETDDLPLAPVCLQDLPHFQALFHRPEIDENYLCRQRSQRTHEFNRRRIVVECPGHFHLPRSFESRREAAPQFVIRSYDDAAHYHPRVLNFAMQTYRMRNAYFRRNWRPKSLK